jgi:hypothetical protein
LRENDASGPQLKVATPLKLSIFGCEGESHGSLP